VQSDGPQPRLGRPSIVDCGVYEKGQRRGAAVPLEEALGSAQGLKEGFAWIGLHDPEPGTVERVGEHFDLPPLAVEDAVHAHQRPKLEAFGDTLFLVVKTAHYDDEAENVIIGEIMVFTGPGFVVTVRHGEGNALTGVREDLEARPELLRVGPSAVLYTIVDRIVDDYRVVLEGLSLDIDEVEADVFSDSRRDVTQRIYRLKREVLEFRRAISPLTAPVERLAGPANELVDPRTKEYFSDVLDHLLRDTERVHSFDEILTGVLQANLAQVTLRDNQDVRRISAWVAIAGVPTMIFGLYGMNFQNMPELGWDLGYPLILVTVLILCAALYVRFRRAGWL
jgi:magnesium transporter